MRREGAAREAARVTRPATEAANGYFGLFEVASAQWKEAYQVEIRSLTEPLNTCNCQDHREFKAARTLAEIGLHTQATPHLTTVLRAGRDALIALYDSATDTLPDHAVPLHRKLMQDLGASATDPPRDAGQFADALALAEEIGRALKTA